MDPTGIRALADALAPFLAIVGLGAIPITLVFLTKHFKLKTRELELEAELHSREAQARINALETRQSAMEGALHALAQALTHREDLSGRAALTEAPPAEARGETAPRGLSSVKSTL